MQGQRQRVTPSYVLPTGFRAEYARSAGGITPCICFMAEYDALDELGHTCGHNLIAEAALGATLALKAALEQAPSLIGRVVCIGTPAEESGSGKVLMFKGGAFTGVDAVIMVHPSTVNDVAPPFLALGKVRARYTGRAAYVIGASTHNVNALDAAVTAHTAVSAMRQQIRPTWKVSGVISNGGMAANVIPDEAELYYFYHAPNAVELDHLRRMLENCLQGAAVATGCALDIDWQDGNEALLTNTPLADVFRKHAMMLGVNMDPKPACKMVFMASSSIGMVSQRIPTIQPTYAISAAPNHSREFAVAAGHADAQGPTLIMAKVMALTGLELFRNTGLLPAIRKDFIESIALQEEFAS
ncbi:xaa-Arg dipeptidase-like [Haemaphysalis longicornis]